ncbi:endo-alpha-1,5-arabinanase [Phlyctema vagabunda]|uniref:Arabinan endo-1,5-alpha-L-arabinosidase n=1 Tax=Phlyctema vagabunda TaxID=108571 RepID=A0ABR4PJA3_9HELO
MMFSLATTFSIVAGFAATVAAYANPGACSGACGSHDPSIIRRDDGTYFRFDTAGGVPISTAPSIKGPWTSKGVALSGGSTINNAGKKDIWAPNVIKVGSMYYMYYAVSSFGTQNSAIGLARSSTMDVGSWTDHGSAGVTSVTGKNYNAIDPNLIAVGSDYYLNFGSFWGDLYQVKMNSNALTGGGSAAYNIAYTPSGTHAQEGAYMFKYGDTYYLFWSAGQCCGLNTNKPAAGGEYKIMVARSKSPTGAFIDKNGKSATAGGGSVVLESHGNIYAPGGQGVFQDPALGPILYYHYFDKTVGISDDKAKFGWNTINFSTGWPTI